MVKFDGIRMQELVAVQDPDKDGGITLVFQDNRYLQIRVKDGKLETVSVPELLLIWLKIRYHLNWESILAVLF